MLPIDKDINKVVLYEYYSNYLPFELHLINDNSPKKEIPVKSKLDDLIMLLTNHFDDIEDKDDIYKSILSYSLRKYDDDFIELSFKEKVISSFGEIWSNLYSIKKKIEAFNLQTSPIIPLMYYFDYFADLFIMLINNDKKLNLEAISKKIKEIVPPSTFNFPSIDFSSDGVGFNAFIEGKPISKHCICSNGCFLFVLLDDFKLLIYSLMEYGSILSYHSFRRVQIDMELKNVFMYTVDSQLFIVSEKQEFVECINTIILSPESSIIKFSLKVRTENICYACNGISLVSIDTFLKINHNQFGEKVEIQKHNSMILPNGLVSFPLDVNIAKKSMFFTNGSMFAFIYPIDGNRYLLRVFSCLSGKHIAEEVFHFSDEILSINLDAVRKCYYLITQQPNNRLKISMAYYIGSEDPFMLYSYPKSFKNKLMKPIFSFFIHFANSQINPNDIQAKSSEQLSHFIDRIFIDWKKGFDADIMFCIIIFISISREFLHQKDISNKLLSLMKILTNQACQLSILLFSFFPTIFLGLNFFNHIDFFMYIHNTNNIGYFLRTIELNDGFFSQNWNKLIYDQIRDCYQCDCSKELKNISSFLFAYQKKLFRYMIINKFNSSGLNCDTVFFSYNEVFWNIIQTNSGKFGSIGYFLRKNHFLGCFALLNLDSFLEKIAPLLPIYTEYFSDKEISMQSISRYLYSKSISKLLSGWTFNKEEERYKWITIPSHFDNDHLISPNQFSNPKIHFFINSPNNAIMDDLYKRLFSQFNRNIDKWHQFDRIIICALAKHKGCLDCLIEGTIKNHVDEKNLVNSMIKIRNNCIKLQLSEKSIEEIKKKAIFLIKCDSNLNNTEDFYNKISLFLFMENVIEYIVPLIREYGPKVQKAQAMLKMLVQSINQMNNMNTLKYLSYHLSQIVSFGNFSSVVSSMKGDSEIINQLILKIIGLIKDEYNEYWISVLYRFLKDIIVKPSTYELVAEFCLEIHSKDDSRTELIVLITSIVSNHYLKCKISGEFRYLSFYSSFINTEYDHHSLLTLKFCELKTMKERLRSTMIAICEGKIEPNMTFMFIFKTIGESIKDPECHILSNEMIFALRRYYSRSDVFREKFTQFLATSVEYKQFEFIFCGMCSLFDTCLLYQYSHNKIRIFKNNMMYNDYLCICNNDGFRLHKFPICSCSEVLCINSLEEYKYKIIPMSIIPRDLLMEDQIKLFLKYDISCSYSCKWHLLMLLSFANLSNQIIDEISHAINYLSEEFITPYNEISEFAQKLSSFISSKPINDKNSFYSMKIGEDSPYSYLSNPIVMEKEPFELSIEFNENYDGLIGIVNSTVDEGFLRYSVIDIQSGMHYPTNETACLTFSTKIIRMSVNPIQKTFSFSMDDSSLIKFPCGSVFRIIICPKTSTIKSLDFSVENFNSKILPDVNSNIFNENSNNQYGRIPKYAVPYSLSTSSLFTYKEKLQFYSMPIIDAWVLHPLKARIISNSLKSYYLEGLFQHFYHQYMTLYMSKVAALDSSKFTLNILLQLYRINSIQSAQFRIEQSRLLQFPFDLAVNNQIGFDFDLSYGNIAKNLLISVESTINFFDHLKSHITQTIMSPFYHFGANQNPFIKYYPRGLNSICFIPKGSIVAVCNYFSFINERIKFEDRDVTLPYFSSKEGRLYNSFKQEIDIVVLQLSNNPRCIIGTHMETILLLNRLVLQSNDLSDKYYAKSILIDFIIVQSPFIYPFIPSLVNYVLTSFGFSPTKNMDEYEKKLIHLKSSFNRNHHEVFDFIEFFYLFEMNIIQSYSKQDDFSISLFSQKAPPIGSIYSIPNVCFNPGAICMEIDKHLINLCIMNFKYQSLNSVPLHSVFPYWFKMEVYNEKEMEFIEPRLVFKSEKEALIENFSNHDIKIVFNPERSVSNDCILSYSYEASRRDETLIQKSMMKEGVSTNKSRVYLKIIDSPATWNEIHIQICLFKENEHSIRSKSTIAIDISKYYEKFIKEIELLMVKWEENDTNILIDSIPQDSFNFPMFSAVYSYAKLSPLNEKYPTNIICLKALMIHHASYIVRNLYKPINESILKSLEKIIISYDIENYLNSKIEKSPKEMAPEIIIDRHSAKLFSSERIGKIDSSIVFQFSKHVSSLDKKVFQTTVPWKVKFLNENAQDFGGPAKELLNEISSSIFDPSSGLFYLTPNSRNKEGFYQDKYLPNDYNDVFRNEYYAIGVFIGIVIRTGFLQDLPFAPLVWDFLGGKEITTNDVFQYHISFEKYINSLKTNEFAIMEFRFENWNGIEIIYNNRNKDGFIPQNEIEQYVNDALLYLKSSLLTPLYHIKEGFTDNTGFNSEPMLSGSRLSKLTQGNNIITIEQFKQYCVIDGYSGLNDPYILRFFRVIEHFDNYQRQSLLKFITTSTRFPRKEHTPDFKIKICKSIHVDPDTPLPLAATCFNKLFLPPYSTDDICEKKILQAITYCNTMENK